MIIRSPLIVRCSLVAAGLKDLSAGSVIAGLSLKLPDPTVRGRPGQLQDRLAYQAVRVVDPADQELRPVPPGKLSEELERGAGADHQAARRSQRVDLKRLEKEYLEYRKQNTVNPSGGKSRTFIARRLDQWDQAISQAMLRSLDIRSQLDLGRQLAEDGASVNQITAALGHLSGTPGHPGHCQPGPRNGPFR